MEPLSLVLAVAGGALGVAADRFATRWPEHDEEHPPGRRVDWRTVAVRRDRGGRARTVAAAVRGRRPRVCRVRCVVRDSCRRAGHGSRSTGAAGRADAAGDPARAPLRSVGLEPAGRWSAGASRSWPPSLIPAVLYLPSFPFGAGAFGMGDVKFLAGMGLMLGGDRALSGTLFGLVLAGVVLLVLLADAADRAQELHPVRSVPDHRGALGGAGAGVTAAFSGRARSLGCSCQAQVLDE